MKAIGLDIGTTSICGILMDGETGAVLRSLTLSNKSRIQGAYAYEACQDPEVIIETILTILKELAEYSEQTGEKVSSVGFSGQMHGILYVDGEGRHVSPLYTWQDQTGRENTEGGTVSYAKELSELTGCPMASGYGLTTLYCHLRKNRIPKEAVRICTIADYAVMRLAGQKDAVITPSNAASLGLFDLHNKCFDRNKCAKAGIPYSFLPEVVQGKAFYCTQDVLGGMLTGVPVACALGDNQASVLGSVREPENTILLNVGTGSQISVGTKQLSDGEIEIRPLVDDSFIYVGAALCGGSSYAALEQFFRKVIVMAGYDPGESVYDSMGKALERLYEERREQSGSQVTVRPLFCGTRKDPSLTASISGLNLENFSPEVMIEGFLKGMTEELYEMYEQIQVNLERMPGRLVGSGNGIRKNPYLRQIMEARFGISMNIPAHTEEASFGAALHGMVCAGEYKTISDAQQLIRYL